MCGKGSEDGETREEIEETDTRNERRMFRVHRFKRARRVQWFRLLIRGVEGTYPTLREVEFFENPKAEITFPTLALVVSTTGERKAPGEGGG